MNVDNSDMDSGLSLGSSSQSIRTRLNNNSGAGVNAGTRVDMTLASDPLSELVWSPHKGLSLKCADCSVADKKASLLWDVGPSKMVISPSHSIRSRGTNDEKPLNEGKMIASQTALHVDTEGVNGVSLANSPRSSGGSWCGSSHGHHPETGDNMEGGSTVKGVSVVNINQKEDYQRSNEERSLCSSKNIQLGDTAETSEPNAGQENQRTADLLPLETNESRADTAFIEPLSGKFNREGMTNDSGRIEYTSGGRQVLGLEIALASEVRTMNECEALDNPVPNLPSPGSRHTELALVIEESKNKMETNDSKNAPLLEKLEFTAENDVQHLIGKDACGQSEERSRRGKSVLAQDSIKNIQIHMHQRKGKDKILSDRDVKERMSIDEDDSHESMESCNSAGLFSKGKKRWSFEQQLIVGSKRIKKQTQATSLVRQDSSFMNWISNMVKGISKSNIDEGPLALTLDRPNHGLETYAQKIITCNRIRDSGSRNMGFQTIFQSLYCPNTSVQETRLVNDDHPARSSKELVLADKTCGANITPISVFGEDNKSCKPCLVSNENFNQSTSGSVGGPSNRPWILSANVVATQETCKTNSAENKLLSHLACSKAKDGVSSSEYSLGKQKTESAEKNNSNPPSEGKAIHNMGYKSDPLASLWIARFSPKTPCPVVSLDHCDQSKCGTLEYSTDCTRPSPQIHTDVPIDQKISETKDFSAENPVNFVGKELQNYTPSTEASISLKRSCADNYKKPIVKLNPIPPSQPFRSTEAMASVFARRLDALKHIIPSDVKDGTSGTRTCFFCGRTGHDLRYCSEVKEAELADLLRNISSYDGAEDSPCLCIRCFQLDHWAITCPVASLNRQNQSEHGASLVNSYSTGKVQLCTFNERYSSPLETNESHSQVDGEHIICERKKRRMDTELCFSPVWNGKMISDQMLDDVGKHNVSSSKKDELKENQITPTCNFLSRQLSDVPKGMFDSIRRLRLSRTDILKWMNCHISLSNLDGFFLRLRLGKCEGGLGGTGYYVACITGMHRGKSPKKSKNPISVCIGGIKCLVESQYVSNHDFLEDELLAWWRTTLKSGTVPVHDDLKSKFEERKKFGF